MIRRLPALALLLACSTTSDSSAQSAQSHPDQLFQGPTLEELEVLEEDLDPKDDDLEDVEDSSHRLLELVVEQVQAARPDLAEEVLAELCKARQEDHVEDDQCEPEPEPAELELEGDTTTTTTPDTGKE